MLDARIYRAAFVPLVLALFVAAFSLERRPPAVTTQLAADSFDGARAAASLEELARSFPDRRPGSLGEEELGARVAEGMRVNGFEVSRRVGRARPVGGLQDSETVVGIRPGVSSRRIVVVADRAALGAPSAGALSGTAALLELARIFRSDAPRAPGEGGEATPRALGRSLRRTLVLVSSSGAALGGGGPAAEAAAETGGPASRVDGVLVLGDLGGGRVRKPWVVPWSNSGAPPPLRLRRTVEAAVRSEVGAPPGAPRAVAQWARRAFPLTVSAQGELAAAGLPAVMLQVSGERGPAARTRVTEERLGEFGRAALRSVSAVDEAPLAAAGRGALSDGTPGIVTVRRVLPDWAVRLLVGTALLPALLAALDVFFRARRRRLATGAWARWTVAAAAPPLLVYAWLRVLGLVGAFGAPGAPVLPGQVAFGIGEAAALASAVLAGGLGVFLVRRLMRRQVAELDPAEGAAAAAAGLVLTGTVAAVWVANPYAAGILVPATHLWLLAATGTWLHGRVAALAVVAALLPAGFVALYYALALALGPLDLAWLAVLVMAGGHLTPAAAAVLALLGACGTATVVVLLATGRAARRQAAAPAPGARTRGPASYAGPGSLGGTESALRR